MNVDQSSSDVAREAARAARQMASEAMNIANATLAMAGDGDPNAAQAAIDAAQKAVDEELPWNSVPLRDYEAQMAHMEARVKRENEILGSEVLMFARTALTCAEAAVEQAEEAEEFAANAYESSSRGDWVGEESTTRAVIECLAKAQEAMISANQLHEAAKRIKHPSFWQRLTRTFRL